MKRVGLLFIVGMMSTGVFADAYTLKKKEIRQKLISCLDHPDNYNSASFNQCVIDAGERFKQAADIKMQQRIQQERIASIRQGWIQDRAIHTQAIQGCERQQELNFQGYSYAAQCELKRSQDYYRYSMSNEMPRDNWSTAQRVDALFIGY